MPTLVVRELPEELHQRLKEYAAQNHRSMSKQVIVILEEMLMERHKRDLPEPVKLAEPITNEFINWAKREGRT